MLRKQFTIAFLMLSTIVLTTFTNNNDIKRRIRNELMRIRGTQELLKKGITNPNVSLNTLKETTRNLANLVNTLAEYVDLDRSASDIAWGRRIIPVEKIWEIDRTAEKAKQKADLNKAVTLTDKILKDLKNYN